MIFKETQTQNEVKSVKIKRFIDCGINTFSCNLRCHYCYVAQNYVFTRENPTFKHPAELVGKALSKERLGGTCLFNLCATGETLMPQVTLDYTKAILEQGHYVMIVTNATITKRFKEIAEWPEELRRHLFFKVSFHYLELKRLKMFDKFFSNIELIKQMGASFTLEITPSDELIPHIEDIKKMSMEKVGALPHITIARDESNPKFPMLTKLSKEEYIHTWGDNFHSALFDFKMKIFGVKRNEYCYAGNWSATLNLQTGTLKQCYCTNFFTNIYRNVEKPIKWVEIGKCKAPHCHNGHAFLAFGAIPELETPYFAELRNRVCADGSEWLNEDMKQMFSSKLIESNSTKRQSTAPLINAFYNVIYHLAMFVRSGMKKLDPKFKSFEKHK